MDSLFLLYFQIEVGREKHSNIQLAFQRLLILRHYYWSANRYSKEYIDELFHYTLIDLGRKCSS